MTTTTKIFVILVCLFAFIFTPMAIQFAGGMHDWRETALRYQELLETAEAQRQATMAVSKSQIMHYQSLRRQDRLEIQDLENQIQDLTKRLVAQEIQLARLARERDSCLASLERTTAQGAILANHNDNLIRNKDLLTKSEAELQTDNALLNERLNELMSTLLIMKQQLEKRDQEMAACRQENEQLRADRGLGTATRSFPSVSPTESVEAVGPVARSPILGRVQEVRREQGRDLVRVDVGSSSGVAEGMTLVVIRGKERDGDYVGDLRITSEVLPTEAVGELTLTGPQGLSPKAGDIVMDVRTFESQ